MSIKCPEREVVQVVVYKPSKQVDANIFNEKKLSGSNKAFQIKNKTQFKKTKRVDPIIQSKKTLEKLRHDVKQFALKSYTPEERRKAEQERAVKLGAIPKKKPYINYKELMKQKKEIKLEQETEMENKPADTKLPSKSRARNDVKKTVFWSNNVKTKTFGQIGNYKDGVLKLSKKDIKSFK